ncbi:MAG TPA: autotransporter outer membrane beta-barrel domain-containing protein [Sphingomicrobium sp.]|nr:autotransporter outer membrane beta-barrel domain-containing protein [Sphingomicrobium sp.]
MKIDRTRATRVALLAACSFGAVAAATPAFGQVAPDGLTVEDYPGIVSRNDIDPNAPAPGGSLDSGVNGVGQMIAFVQSSPTAAGLGLCTGTLINPRTVIFAAHCVNTRPAHMYGSQTGTSGGVNGNFGTGGALLTSQGVPLSFGFSATNRCQGVTVNGCAVGTGPYELWRDGNFATNVASYIYNANQVWYDPRSLSTPGSNGFIAADVALATLDTPAFNVPTWTMLFSPLTEATHALSIGYGQSGTAASVQGPTACTTNCNGLGVTDYRRRIVENSLDVLGSIQDRNIWLFGPGSAGLNSNSVYMLDFDSPAGQAAYTGAFNNYDFDIFNGAALPREGTTAPGDSGGPLVVDQKFSKPVVVGVLSGGSRFHSGQRFGTYGTHSFYQPLFLYWDVIVENNPYVYASAKAGNGNWEDASHWVQVMDPNYAIVSGGALANSLPDTPALGVSPNTVKFGQVCFLDDCTDLADDDTATPVPVGDGNPIYIAGGPGTTNFIPDNVNPVNNADPALTVKARYFDVTLSEAGTTTLSSERTIDRLTLDGNATKLTVGANGKLNVFGEATQWQGWTQVDGLLKSGGDYFVGTGLLSGTGTIRAPFVTVAAAYVAPGGGDKIGTLTIQGNAILSSGSSLFIDAQRGKADELKVVADGAGTGILALNGGNVVFNKVTDGPAPRDGEKYVIASAQGGVDGTFGSVYTFQGVLRPELTYSANAVTATLRAKSLVTVLSGQNATAIAFANALDKLRTGFYDKLWNLYGNIDWMNGAQLNATFNAMAPQIFGETQLIQDRQSRQMLGNISDRLSLLGTGQASGFSFSGTPMAMVAGYQPTSPQAILGLRSTGSGATVPISGKLSGFAVAGGDNIRSSYGNSRSLEAGQHSRYFASGVEAPFGDVMVGTAVGYAEATTNAATDNGRTKLMQAAAYASKPIGKSAYVGGVVSADIASTTSIRMASDTVSMFQLSGASRSSRYTATVESGFRTSLGSGLALNPRAQVRASHMSLGGFREQGGETALELNSLKLNRIESRLGAKLDGTTQFAGWTVRPQVQADYVRLLSGRTNGLSVSFAAAPDYDFVLPLTNGGSGWVEMKGGVEMTRGAFSLGLTGQATAGSAPLSDKRGLIQASFRF